MSKDRGRKGELRAPKLTADALELMQLANVLAEYQLDNNAHGWFRPPWRDGEWAVGLAKSAALINGVKSSKPWQSDSLYTTFSGADFLNEMEALKLIDEAPRNSETYEKAGQLYREIVQPKINTDTACLLAAALRCLQLKIANSHGGGSIYNEILIPAFLPIKPHLVEKLVLDFRCNDAIGTSRQLRNDHNDRQRSAFTIAWKRGLYLAAYSLPPAR